MPVVRKLPKVRKASSHAGERKESLSFFLNPCTRGLAIVDKIVLNPNPAMDALCDYVDEHGYEGLGIYDDACDDLVRVGARTVTDCEV